MALGTQRGHPPTLRHTTRCLPTIAHHPWQTDKRAGKATLACSMCPLQEAFTCPLSRQDKWQPPSRGNKLQSEV